MASTSALTVLRLRSFLGALKPSFFGRRHMKPRTLHPTSYLDGLRGVAALFVVFNHYVAQYFPYITHGWRSGDPALENNDRIVQLPIIRTIYSGRFMVTIFFVISGYVLSHKALGLARRRDFSSLLKSLSSSVFRRWLRLMLPALVSSIIGLILARIGLAHNLYSDWETPDSSDIVRVAIEAKLPPRREATLQVWLQDSLIMVDPFQFGNIKFPKFNFPLWTMQVEYMGSMIVFVVVLGISLARPAFRVAIPSMLVAFCLFTGRWQWCLFISGVLLAELSHENSAPPTSLLDTGIDDITEKTTPPPSSSFYRKVLFYLPDSAAFITACYIGTYPEYNPETSPGYRWLSKFVPPTWAFFGGYFYPVLASIILVSSLEHGKFLQKIFTTRIAQYLGDISLSLYMLHTQVELSLGNWLVPRCLRFMAGFEGLNFAIGMSMALSCCAILTLWASDIFWRVVDIKSVKFAKWVSVRCFVDDD